MLADATCDITQIIPSDGWVALISADEGDVPDVHPVACWALVVHDKCYQTVEALVAFEGKIVRAPSIPGYLDIGHAEDVIEEIFCDDEDDEDGDSNA